MASRLLMHRRASRTEENSPQAASFASGFPGTKYSHHLSPHMGRRKLHFVRVLRPPKSRLGTVGFPLRYMACREGF